MLKRRLMWLIGAAPPEPGDAEPVEIDEETESERINKVVCQGCKLCTGWVKPIG